MQVTLLKSKLHRATVTSVAPDYSGSLSIDLDLMEAAGFLHHEKILVGNISNGERF
ncbi:MAG: aspartate 1-decarboxylase, partial [Verrucomicrobiota bacterium]|nr:aspartate 1-decarboxylase [Verrucomicrobiota bacterium]